MLKYCDENGNERTIIDDENINDYVSGKEFPVFFHNNDLKIINDNGDIEIGESSDVNTHVTRITNDCNMAFDLVVGGNIGIKGDMSVEGEIDQVGNLADLTTDAKTNLVSAINEVNAKPTTTDLHNQMQNIFRVGYVYISFDATNPANIFGFGTWQLITNRFLLGAGGSYGINSTGGEAKHTLSTNELPSHNHYFNWSGSHTHKRFKNTNTDGWSYEIAIGRSGRFAPTVPDSHDNASAIGDTTITVSGYTYGTGSGVAHNNMPPYIAVYMWRRTA